MAEKQITGRLVLDGWAGRSETLVEVIGQTPKRLRIRAITRTKLAGRDRWLRAGEVALVPAAAVLDNCELCKGAKGGVPGNENVVNGRVLCDYCSRVHAAREER